jgi:hypothetical protein
MTLDLTCCIADDRSLPRLGNALLEAAQLVKFIVLYNIAPWLPLPVLSSNSAAQAAFSHPLSHSGAGAMLTQVFSLLWLRTTMNYQYRNGGSFRTGKCLAFLTNALSP